ncbi:MAG: tetratricopeptide repeat protein [Candidatus Kapaibacterium sp.]
MHNTQDIHAIYSKIQETLSMGDPDESAITTSILDNIIGLQSLEEEVKFQIFDATHRAVQMLSRFRDSGETGTQKLGYLLLHKAIYEHLPIGNRAALEMPILMALRASWNHEKSTNANHFTAAERIVSHAEIFHQYTFISEVWLEAARMSWTTFYSPEDALSYIQRSLSALEQLRDHSAEYSYADSTFLQASALRLRGEIQRHSGQFEEAINDLTQAVHLFGGLHSAANLIDCYCLAASVYFLNNEFGKAREFLDIALAHPQLHQHPIGYASALNLLGTIASSHADADGAKEYHLRSLQLFKEHGDYAGQASALLNLGTLSEEQGEAEHAEAYYSQSLVASEHSGNRTEQSLVLNNLGKIYLDTHKFDLALTHFERSYQISKAIGNLPNQELALLNMSQLYSTTGEYDSALQSLESLRKIIGETGHRILEAAALINVGEIYFQTQNYRASRQSFQNSLQILDEIGENPPWKSEAVDGLKKLQRVTP